jgi:predicted porin
MKKRLIALAALASAGAAMAQSNVTLYGRLDASIGTDKNHVTNVSNSQLFSGMLTTSRLGFRGTEDLGGGLKANFQLEAPLTVDNGNAAGLAFTRASWVGLSGGFGALRLGLTDSPYKDLFDLGNSHAVYDSAFSPYNVAYAGLANSIGRPANTVRYDTPNLGGFSSAVSYSFNEDSATTPQVGAFNVRYKGGPVDVGLAHQNQNNKNNADPATLDRDYTLLAASFDFGAARLSGSYQITDQSGAKDKEFTIGVSVPLGAFDVSAGYARGKSENAAGANNGKGTAFALGATYALSKRTRVYGGYLNGDVENAEGTTTTDRTLYSFGVRHDF